jgi:hypothetical protein
MLNNNNSINDKNNRTAINDTNESNMTHHMTFLSTSLSSVVEEYEEKRNSPIADRSQRRKQQWSDRLHKSETDLSATEIETDDDDDFGLAVQNQDSVENHDHYDEEEDGELPKSSFLTEFRKSKSFVLRRQVVFAGASPSPAKKNIDKLQDHRWSPYGCLSRSARQRLPGATAGVDYLPKQCRRRPSLENGSAVSYQQTEFGG